MRLRVLAWLAAIGSAAPVCGIAAGRWTILGPAISYHASTDAARVEQQVATDTTCMRGPRDPPIGAQERCRTTVNMTQTRRWNERHAAIGLEYGVQGHRRTSRAFAALVEDSYGKAGWMAGAGWTWRLARGQGWQAHGGLAAGLWHRSVLDEDDATALRRRVRALAMPVLLVDSPGLGVGLSLGYAPEASLRGEVLNATSVWMFQLRLQPRSPF